VDSKTDRANGGRERIGASLTLWQAPEDKPQARRVPQSSAALSTFLREAAVGKREATALSSTDRTY
jgi:hypothetical protein